MPVLFKILLAVMGVDVALRVFNYAMGTGSLLSVIIGGLILAGLIKGSEGVRMLVIIFSVIGLVTSGVGLLAAGGAPALMIGLVIGMASGGFTIFTLTRPDVQAYMLRSATGFDDDEP